MALYIPQKKFSLETIQDICGGPMVKTARIMDLTSSSCSFSLVVICDTVQNMI